MKYLLQTIQWLLFEVEYNIKNVFISTIKMHTTAHKIMFKILKLEMYLITRENSLPTSQNEGRFPIKVPNRLNEFRANDRWLC